MSSLMSCRDYFWETLAVSQRGVHVLRAFHSELHSYSEIAQREYP